MRTLEKIMLCIKSFESNHSSSKIEKVIISNNLMDEILKEESNDKPIHSNSDLQMKGYPISRHSYLLDNQCWIKGVSNFKMWGKNAEGDDSTSELYNLEFNEDIAIL